MIFEKATEEMMIMANKKGPKPKWPLAHMTPGDTIVIKDGEYGASNPQIYAVVFGRQKGWKFKTSKIGQSSYRIIRIS